LFGNFWDAGWSRRQENALLGKTRGFVVPFFKYENAIFFPKVFLAFHFWTFFLSIFEKGQWTFEKKRDL
jgi:hypothetical protein